jgi:hypothetical protein
MQKFLGARRSFGLSAMIEDGSAPDQMDAAMFRNDLDEKRPTLLADVVAQNRAEEVAAVRRAADSTVQSRSDQPLLRRHFADVIGKRAELRLGDVSTAGAK